MSFADMSRRLIDVLGLSTPPVALTFADKAPDGFPEPSRVVPSACSFWRDAEKGTFYASAEQHHNCPIGAMVMGFTLPEEVQKQLGELVTGMCDQNYMSADEPPKIPTVGTQYAGIIYGPLAERDAQPDVVLLWASSIQAMLCNEAMGTASWTSGTPMFTGRPGCAALPMAIDQSSPTLSLGCAGMRTFTEIGDDRLLIAIPGSKLAEILDSLEETRRVNDHMNSFYQAHRDAVAQSAASST